MLTVFPPTSIEMGVSNVQGTRIFKIHKKVSTDSGTGERTSVDAISNLGCQLSTTNRVEKFRNAGGVTDNLRCSSVEDCCCTSYYRFSVHRNAIKRGLPVSLSTKRAYQ